MEFLQACLCSWGLTFDLSLICALSLVKVKGEWVSPGELLPLPSSPHLFIYTLPHLSSNHHLRHISRSRIYHRCPKYTRAGIKAPDYLKTLPESVIHYLCGRVAMFLSVTVVLLSFSRVLFDWHHQCCAVRFRKHCVCMRHGVCLLSADLKAEPFDLCDIMKPCYLLLLKV